MPNKHHYSYCSATSGPRKDLERPLIAAMLTTLNMPLLGAEPATTTHLKHQWRSNNRGLVDQQKPLLQSISTGCLTSPKCLESLMWREDDRYSFQLGSVSRLLQSTSARLDSSSFRCAHILFSKLGKPRVKKGEKEDPAHLSIARYGTIICVKM